MMQITFRLATEKDKRVFPWKREGIDQTRPTVVTVNGHVVLMNHGPKIIYQRSDLVGQECIADLLRAQSKAYSAMRRMDYEGSLEIRKRGKDSRLSPDYEDPWVALRDLTGRGVK